MRGMVSIGCNTQMNYKLCSSGLECLFKHQEIGMKVKVDVAALESRERTSKNNIAIFTPRHPQCHPPIIPYMSSQWRGCRDRLHTEEQPIYTPTRLLKKRSALRIEESCHVQTDGRRNKLKDAFPMIPEWGCFVVLLLDHNYKVLWKSTCKRVPTGSVRYSPRNNSE